MPDAVREALKQVLIAEGGMTEEQAETYIKEMDSTKRYQAETWS